MGNFVATTKRRAVLVPFFKKGKSMLKINLMCSWEMIEYAY
jgi:hypothetical protein